MDRTIINKNKKQRKIILKISEKWQSKIKLSKKKKEQIGRAHV